MQSRQRFCRDWFLRAMLASPDDLPPLQLRPHNEARLAHQARLQAPPLQRLRQDVQREDRDALKCPRIPDRHRAARGVMAATLQPLRDLAETFLEREFAFTHEAVREWEARFAPLVAGVLRRRRSGKRGGKWHVDEAYLKVEGKRCYLYRAVDKPAG